MKSEKKCQVTSQQCIHIGKDHLKKCSECRYHGPSFGYIEINTVQDKTNHYLS